MKFVYNKFDLLKPYLNNNNKVIEELEQQVLSKALVEKNWCILKLGQF